MSGSVEVWENTAAMRASVTAPVLSICIPFFKVDVCPLAAELVMQTQSAASSLEMIWADDGSDEAGHIDGLKAVLRDATAACRVVVATQNVGRAAIRNLLGIQASGRFVLFLDSDMYPDNRNFVDRYMQLARQGVADIVVGGCSYRRLEVIPLAARLYHYHSDRTQCVCLDTRTNAPLWYVFTNNVMLRKTLLDEVAFDAGYRGWGYEDTDWTIAATNAGAKIEHIDNSATHFGLIDDDKLILKYRESTANFLRLTRKFPEQAMGMPAFRVASRLSRWPLPFSLLAWMSECMARRRFLPLRVRYLFLQSLRAFLYSQALARQSVS